ncbi:hypothetical protein ABZ371_16510 [Streptomyces sp. NPDC005899]
MSETTPSQAEGAREDDEDAVDTLPDPPSQAEGERTEEDDEEPGGSTAR